MPLEHGNRITKGVLQFQTKIVLLLLHMSMNYPSFFLGGGEGGGWFRHTHLV